MPEGGDLSFVVMILVTPPNEAVGRSRWEQGKVMASVASRGHKAAFPGADRAYSSALPECFCKR
jgi:hypothetical protein